ncbi:MAG TPA: hypothetical protein VI424_15670, partial [Terriglobales bacterium]
MRRLKFAFLFCLLGASLLAFAAEDEAFSSMPPNPEKIAIALRKRGVIPPNATPAQAEAAVNAYLRLKMKGPDKGNPLARHRVENNENLLNAAPSNLRGRKLGNSFYVGPSAPQFQAFKGSGKL